MKLSEARILFLARESIARMRDEGLVEFGRGSGITVTGTAERGAVLRQVRELVEFARRQGYKRESIIAMIENLT